MKHLSKYNESKISESDILDNFLLMSDILGKPTVVSKKWGNDIKWIIQWNLGLDISASNDATEFIKKFKIISSELDDISSIKNRLPNFEPRVYIKHNRLLVVELVPVSEAINIESLKFIKAIDVRIIWLNIANIERFFLANGLRVLKVREDEDDYCEITETCSVHITIDKFDRVAFEDFVNRFRLEFRNKSIQEGYNRYVNIEYRGNQIIIYPDDEKIYVLMG